MSHLATKLAQLSVPRAFSPLAASTALPGPVNFCISCDGPHYGSDKNLQNRCQRDLPSRLHRYFIQYPVAVYYAGRIPDLQAGHYSDNCLAAHEPHPPTASANSKELAPAGNKTAHSGPQTHTHTHRGSQLRHLLPFQCSRAASVALDLKK